MQVKQHHRLVGALKVADDVSGMERRRDIKPHVLKIACGALLVPLTLEPVVAGHHLAVCIKHDHVIDIVVFGRIDGAASNLDRFGIVAFEFFPDGIEALLVTAVRAVKKVVLVASVPRVVLKEIQTLAVCPYKVCEFSLLLFDDIAQKGIEVRDVDRVISAAHGAIGHIVDDLLPAFELLLQCRFMRAVDDKSRYGCGELVVDSLKMLLNAV